MRLIKRGVSKVDVKPINSLNKFNSFTKISLILLTILIISLIAPNNSSYAGVEGCYIFPSGSEDLVCQDNTLKSEAQSDCESYSDCEDFDDYFYSGKLCSSSEFDEVCEEVICSVDCDYHALTVCEDMGGEAINDDDYDVWCSEGCCKVGDFCNYVSTKYECLENAEQRGYSVDDLIYETNDIDPDTCQTDYCGVELTYGSVSGYVLNESGSPINGAEVELTTSNTYTTSSDGHYSFSDINPGSYVIKTSAEGYYSDSSSLSISSGEAEEINITLSIADEYSNLFGYVYDSEGNTVSSVTICYDGTSISCITSESDGFYNITNIYTGEYSITLSKYSYSTTEIDLTLVEGDNEQDLTLSEIEFQGITGDTWLDENGDNLADDLVYGAKIYVDGVYKGSSDYPNGDFAITLDSGTYNVSATYQDYASEDYEVTISDGETEDIDLLMTKYIGECSYGQENDQKSVEELTATTSTGELVVDLGWDKPCSEVSGYYLYRDGELILTLSPIAVSYSDETVEWGNTYTYEIWAVYTDGPVDNSTGDPQSRLSSSGASVTVTLGSDYCEGFESGQYFCMADDSSTEDNEKKYIYTCDSSNNLVTSSDCSSLDDSGSDWYCTEASPGYAVCKDAGNCNVLQQEADPFGLYYNRDTCYGGYSETSGYENYCYYDFTDTVSDKCYSCEEFDSCFDYVSEDACTSNNCLGVGCTWIYATAEDVDETSSDGSDSEDESMVDYSILYQTTFETGQGYCIEDNYEEDDQCYSCGPDANLFENDYCTPYICTNLGRCFSEDDLSLCDECGNQPTDDANCYEYNSELECISDQNIENSYGEIMLSEDRCSWGRCSWVETDSNLSTGYCIKDGDADDVEDCSEFSAGEYGSCEVDNDAPETVVEGESFSIVSVTYPNVTFTSVDNSSALSELYFCLSSSDASSCTSFESAEYDGVVNEESLSVNLINSSYLSSNNIAGETYLLRFYSKDKYYNQESVKETYVYVDNELPEFEIETEYTTEADSTELTVYLSEMNEMMACDFTLTPILPEGDNSTSSFSRDVDKEKEYSGLTGVIYDVIVECMDDHANVNTKNVTLVFDQEQDITLVYPAYEQPIDETSIEFQIETAVSASCELYLYDEETLSYDFVTDFINQDEDNKEHKTESISGFYEGEYAGTVEVVCVESLTDDYLEDYFYFSVDFSAPDTQIILTEGDRVEEPTGYGWEAYFVEEVSIDFECDAEGFECQTTYYCIGDGCEYSTSEDYVEYSETATVTNTTQVCYYSTDESGSYAYPECGDIIVEGFGIKQVNPDGFYYENELWGVSNSATFDWEIMSKLETDECKFDFNSEFDFDSVPSLRTFDDSDPDDYYVIENFPTDVLSDFDEGGSSKTLYVKCIDQLGEISPSQKINLEYDPTAPSISSAYADPSNVMEGIETDLYVTTDDKTVCRYSDNSGGAGSVEFDTMEYSFPGYEDSSSSSTESTYYTSHETTFSFSFDGAQKDYSLNVQCMNGAGDVSEVSTITFSVDYSASGYIVSTSPEGYISYTNVSLGVETNKNAYCYYDDTDFETTGGTTHTQSMGTLDEGEYHYLVTCLVGENNREGEIDFNIDLTAPVISSIDDGTYTCGLSQVKLLVYTDESNISSYYYELYQGEPESSSSSSSSSSSFSSSSSSSSDSNTTTTLISNGTLPSSNETTISATFTENETYYVKVLAVDAAGNWGEYVSSDGFTAVSSNYSYCAEDESAPSITLQTNTSCTATYAELICEDENGCSEFKYGTSSSSSTCSADSDYYGNQITFDTSGWICYYVEDVNGNNKTGLKKVTFSDDDSDGVSDDCDTCSDTSGGKAVDSEGCAYGQVPDEEEGNDKDEDGLPDYWEKLFDQTSCEFNYLSEDTDGDGTIDGYDDNDGDGYTNYDEYKQGYDPCVADERGEDDSGSGSSSNTTTTDPTTPVTEPEDHGLQLIGLVLLILGILLAGGGVGYLVYFYMNTPQGKRIFSGAAGGMRQGPSVSGQGRQMQRGSYYQKVGQQRTGNSGQQPSQAMFSGLLNLGDKLKQLSKTHLQRSKSNDRKKLFSGFSHSDKGSKGIIGTHFKDVFESGKTDPHEKIKDVVNTYQKHREEIRGSVKKGDQSLFNKLDKLSQQSKTKSLQDIISKKDANNIFDKLKKISKG